MMAALLGLKAAIVYFTIAFVAAVIFGSILNALGFEKQIKNVRVKGGVKVIVVGKTFIDKCRTSASAAWKDYRKILPYILIGVGVGALIYGAVPSEFLTKVAGEDNPAAVPIAALLGVPLYIRASAALAIVAPLIEKGVSVGTAIALVVGGAGMAIPEMTMLAGLFRPKLVVVLVAVVFLTAVASGLLFNMMNVEQIREVQPQVMLTDYQLPTDTLFNRRADQ